MTDFKPSLTVSYSSMSTHNKCPQAWNYSYVQDLERIDTGLYDPRDFGSWWHALRAADSIARGRELGTLKYAPDTIETSDGGPVLSRIGDGDDKIPGRAYSLPSGQKFAPSATLIIRLAEAWWKTLSDEVKESWEESIGGTLAERLNSLNERYNAMWAEELAAERPLAVEVKWTRELPQTDGAVIKGTIDEIYIDSKRNLIVARDHKTGKTLDPSDSVSDLLDSQLQVYAWGVLPLVKEWGFEKIDAVEYDRTRSAAPKLPAVTSSGSLSKSTADYDLQTYLDWCANGVPWGVEGEYFKSGKRKGEPKFGTYTAEDEVIAKLSDPASLSVWHQRSLMPINLHVMRAHLVSIIESQRASVKTEKRAKETGEAARNMSKMGCKFCDYSKLCAAQLRGGSDGYYEPLSDFGLQKRIRKTKTNQETGK